MEMSGPPEATSKPVVGVRLLPETALRLKTEAVRRGTNVSAFIEVLAANNLVDTDFSEWTKTAREVLVIGPTLSQTLQDYTSTWRRRLDEGCNLKFLLMAPRSEELEWLGLWLEKSADSLSEEIEASIRGINELGFYNNRYGLGSVTLRFRETALPWSAARIETLDGVQLRMDVFPILGETQRTSLVLAAADPQFSLVDRQIKALWMSAKDTERKWRE